MKARVIIPDAKLSFEERIERLEDAVKENARVLRMLCELLVMEPAKKAETDHIVTTAFREG
jgi:hypothetical protein